MFANKIEGESRVSLLEHLCKLYSEGYLCLLSCPSLCPELQYIMFIPWAVRMLPTTNCSNSWVAVEIIGNSITLQPPNDVNAFMLNIETLENLLVNASNALEAFVFRRWLSHCLSTVCSSKITYFSESNKDNKSDYNTMSNILILVHRCRFDAVCHFLYKAVILFNFGSYKCAVTCLDRANNKLENPFCRHWWDLSIENYKAAGGEHQPIITGARKTLCAVFNIELKGVLEINELFIETHSGPVTRFEAPPKVFILFLKYLSLSKLGHSAEKEQMLKEFVSILSNNIGSYTLDVGRSVSWQLLGICQQMEGKFREAWYSYLMSLRQNWVPYKRASCIRLCTILATYFQ